MESSRAQDKDELGRAYGDRLHDQVWQLEVEAPTAAQEAEVAPIPATTKPARPSRTKAAPPASPPPSLRIIEAILFVGGLPLTVEQACESIRGLTAEQFLEAIDGLNRAYREQSRPYMIQKQDQAYALALRPGYRFLTDKLFGGVRETRLSQPAVDVLAIVAYRQPVSKHEVESVRGHESSALLRQLVRRGLIAVVNRAESGGRVVHYGTTPRFLELFGLQSLDDLPQTEDLQRL